MNSREELLESVVLRLADNIIAHGSNITYPSRMAAQEVRNVVRELAAMVRNGAAQRTPNRTLEAIANRIEELKPYAAKSPDGAEWDQYVITVSEIDRRRIIAALRTSALTSTLRNPIDNKEDSASWRPIETAPKDKSIMLCVEGFEPCVGRWWPVTGVWSSFDWEGHFESDQDASEFYNGSSYQPTHWMPLPSGPVTSTDRCEGK